MYLYIPEFGFKFVLATVEVLPTEWRLLLRVWDDDDNVDVDVDVDADEKQKNVSFSESQMSFEMMKAIFSKMLKFNIRCFPI